MRLFVAIALPDAVKVSLGDVIGRLRPSAPDEKWVPTQNLHVTISFLGEVQDERVASIGETVGEAVATLPPVPTGTAVAGAFPSARRARVLWAGLADDVGRLTDAARAVIGALEPIGFPPEKRPWAPHVTLARFRAPRDAAGLIAAASIPAETFTVEAVTLFRSRLARPSPVYEPLAEFPLAG